MVEVAACRYPIEPLADWDAYAAKLHRLMSEAAGAGARLLVFPEYASLELAALFPPAVRGDLQATLAAMQGLLPGYLALHRTLAADLGVHVLGASFPVREHGRYLNRAFLFAPDGGEGFQDKLIMTRFEAEHWGISPGSGVRVFDTALGRLAVAICYDAEFPLLAAAQVQTGAELLLVPSCTDCWAGYHRVRIACQARALEGQCYVVQAVTSGEAPWSPAVDVNVGFAGIFCPPDYGLPDEGVLALGDDIGWTRATLDMERLSVVRRDGQVRGLRDWALQARVVAAGVEVVRLGT